MIIHLFGELNSINNFNKESITSIVWQQKSAESKALYYQGYEIAKIRLIQIRNEKPTLGNLAVVLDIDETVLDNSPFQASLAYSYLEYNQNKWYDWTNAKRAELLPGVERFFTVADSLGFEIILISNRDASERDVTFENLARYNLKGLKKENIFLREYESGKESRRNSVSENYSIELLLGDNLGDFNEIFDDKDSDSRVENVRKLADQFGQKYIIFPNPMYGTWENSLYSNIPDTKTSKLKSEIRKKTLDRFKTEK